MCINPFYFWCEPCFFHQHVRITDGITERFLITDFPAYYNIGSGKLLEGVKAEAKFTPKGTSGKTVVEITVDTAGIQGHNLVVFEELYALEASERLIAEHKDANDKEQAVTVYNPPKDYPKTGDTTRMWIWFALLGAAGAGLIAAYIIMIKKNSKNKKEKAD